MRSRVFSAVLPAVLVACAPSVPPASAPAASTSPAADVPPVLALLDARERLALSADQVVALESIARDWEAANDTLARRAGVTKGRGASPLRLALGKQARLARTAIAENNRRTALAVERVLQPDQRETLCTAQQLQREMASVARTAKSGAAMSSAANAGKGRGRSFVPAAHASRREKAVRAWPWCPSEPSYANEARSAT